MRTPLFQDLLLRSAVIAIACDGSIDTSEVDEINNMAVNEIYFLGFDYQPPFATYLADIRIRGKRAIEEYLAALSKAPLNDQQKLLLIEVLIRVMKADSNWAENEKALLHMAIKNIQVAEEVVIEAFPEHAGLFLSGHSSSFDDNFHDTLSS
ncbi:MAG: hypothetical protein IPO87_06470 [Flavobacteriales bacterium]|nr:hypothetical protein [Flavobacteriales bacterium]